ncbi:MAG: SH3 domain-containing protein [Clostridia bacterium]|nr:SH3 domain-containing protein [Clostridia bacterium]MBQ7051363.1 SH3 domain-containing protein [Clostridia bacterium]
MLYLGRVELSGGKLNIRARPGGEVIDALENGREVQVITDEGEWLGIAYGEQKAGFAAKRYIVFVSAAQRARLVIEDEAGNCFAPEGGVTVRLEEGLQD